jgi:hypothetical protein
MSSSRIAPKLSSPKLRQRNNLGGPLLQLETGQCSCIARRVDHLTCALLSAILFQTLFIDQEDAREETFSAFLQKGSQVRLSPGGVCHGVFREQEACSVEGSE